MGGRAIISPWSFSFLLSFPPLPLFSLSPLGSGRYDTISKVIRPANLSSFTFCFFFSLSFFFHSKFPQQERLKKKKRYRREEKKKKSKIEFVKNCSSVHSFLVSLHTPTHHPPPSLPIPSPPSAPRLAANGEGKCKLSNIYDIVS